MRKGQVVAQLSIGSTGMAMSPTQGVQLKLIV